MQKTIKKAEGIFIANVNTPSGLCVKENNVKVKKNNQHTHVGRCSVKL